MRGAWECKLAWNLKFPEIGYPLACRVVIMLLYFRSLHYHLGQNYLMVIIQTCLTIAYISTVLLSLPLLNTCWILEAVILRETFRIYLAGESGGGGLVTLLLFSHKNAGPRFISSVVCFKIEGLNLENWCMSFAEPKQEVNLTSDALVSVSWVFHKSHVW